MGAVRADASRRDKHFLDFSGDCLGVVAPQTGEYAKAKLFFAVLGCEQADVCRSAIGSPTQHTA